MPSPLLQLRIPQDLADWLEAKHPSRGEVAAYVRQLLTAEQMKEAVAPLVPDFFVCNCGHPETLHRKNGAFAPCQIALCECQQFSKPVPQLSVEGEPLNEYEMATGYRQEPKPKARRKKLADPPGTRRDKGALQAERRMAIKSGLIPPDSCNRGACPGTIHPRTGSCTRCMQKPLKESK